MNSKAKQRHASTGSGREAEPFPEDDDDLPVLAERDERADAVDEAAGSHLFDVTEEDKGKRLDRFLAERFSKASGLSRTRLQALIAAGSVLVNEAPVLAASTVVEVGTRIAVAVPPPVSATPQAEIIPLTIVFEDEHLLVLDKPAGLVVHPAAGHETGTLVNALIAHCGDSLSGIGGVRRPGIVHRLDKDTSGLLVVAKTDRAHQGLSDLFADHGRSGSLERAYTAIVWGRPETPGGTIDMPLGRHAHQRDKMAVVSEERGRHALTHWSLEADHGFSSEIRCVLETGRTHQIRVHLTEIGHPLIGDPVYGTGFKTKAARLSQAAQAAIVALGRQALHASVLGFEHPVTGETLYFESPLPADLARLQSALEDEQATGAAVIPGRPSRTRTS